MCAHGEGQSPRSIIIWEAAGLLFCAKKCTHEVHLQAHTVRIGQLATPGTLGFSLMLHMRSSLDNVTESTEHFSADKVLVLVQETNEPF